MRKLGKITEKQKLIQKISELEEKLAPLSELYPFV